MIRLCRALPPCEDLSLVKGLLVILFVLSSSFSPVPLSFHLTCDLSLSLSLSVFVFIFFFSLFHVPISLFLIFLPFYYVFLPLLFRLCDLCVCVRERVRTVQQQQSNKIIK